jgi:hypothetical protein
MSQAARMFLGMTSHPPTPADPRPIPPAGTTSVRPNAQDGLAAPDGLPPVLAWLSGQDTPDGPGGPGAATPGVASQVAAAADGLAGLDLDRLSGRQLLDLVATLGPVADRVALTVALAFGRAEACDATIELEGLLAGAWLSQSLRTTGADRTTLACVGQVLPTLPHLCDAARSGLISWSEVRPICLAAARLTMDDRRQLDLQLVAEPAALPAMTPGELLALCDQVIDELHPKRLQRDEAAEFTSQWVAFRPRFDGTGQIHGDLDAVTFTDIADRVEGLADQLPSPPDRPDDPRWRSRGHRQALALHALVTRDGSDRPGTSAHMLVTLDSDRDAAILHHRRGARAMSAAQLARLLARAEIRTILTTGGIPLKVGRTRRYATPAQRDAAFALWGSCAWPGCDAPPAACDLHHVQAFDDDGPTDDDNLVPLCAIHHHAITHGHWTLTLDGDRTVHVRRGRHHLSRTPRAVTRARAGPRPTARAGPARDGPP